MRIKHRSPIAWQSFFPELVLLSLWTGLYAPLLLYWCDGWINKTISIEHEYFSHGLLGLPFAGYIAWERRQSWQKLSNVVKAWEAIVGLALWLGSLVLYFGTLPDLVNLSLPIGLMGLCLWLKGWAGLRLQAFPLLLVFLATPNQVPYLLAPYTLPLQQFIAGTAGFLLMQFGMDIQVEQIYLFVNDRIVEVAPYCAGLKMLFTSLYVGLIMLYWTGVWRSQVKSTIFIAGIVLISVAANIIRNTLLTYLHGTKRNVLFHWLHDSWGGDLYSAAMLFFLILVLRCIEFWNLESSEIESFGIELEQEGSEASGELL
ncbi:cyanoexosortase B [Thermocoleostomius sinensis]|uniref:Cyanoexosortase B n=1 Tax=Thermocoleostomius sinensis A174 TaxID=2016057 RepID=A0A9E8ZCC5_9CYAN|nr:cyanoexosortase B [Thermocoleostomius sinensis]WAL59247.1 cyanoexosortase B [Thermocoleostomius sinensis A174]